MFRKTLKQYHRTVKSDANAYLKDTHRERVLVETWWFLFIPLYSRETITASNL